MRRGPAGARLEITPTIAMNGGRSVTRLLDGRRIAVTLPPGLRRSLYLKDDDYRLSFLYGNFTTLTRFTEADLERVVTEGLR